MRRAAVGAARDAAAAVERAVGDGASAIVCGCGVAESAIAAELARAKEQCIDEVLKAARHSSTGLSLGRSAALDAAWGAMWARLDELCNASLNRCIQAAKGLGEWSNAALPGLYGSVEALVREALRRARTVWNHAAMRIGRAMSDAALKLHDLFAQCEENWQARLAAAADDGAATSSAPPGSSSDHAETPATPTPITPPPDEAAASSAGGPLSLDRLRAAQASLAALLYAAAKQCVGALAKNLEQLLVGLSNVRQGLLKAPSDAQGALMTYLASSSEGASSLQRTTREAHNWERADTYEEVERLLGGSRRSSASPASDKSGSSKRNGAASPAAAAAVKEPTTTSAVKASPSKPPPSTPPASAPTPSSVARSTPTTVPSPMMSPADQEWMAQLAESCGRRRSASRRRGRRA